MLKDLLTQDSFYSSMPDDDLIAKQRYKLFRTTSIVGTIACYLFAIQSVATFYFKHPLVVATLVIGTIFFINLMALWKHKNHKLAYIVLNILAITVIHFHMYWSGGVRASAAYYFAPITLMAFMLLGNKIGRIFFLLVAVNIGYFYFMTEYTNNVSLELIGDTHSLINLDFLITSVFAFFILSAQLNYLESGKNIVIERITSQRNELRIKNKELHKLSIVASKADNAIVITDNKGVAEWVNDGFVRLTKFKSEEVIGKRTFDLLHGARTNKEVRAELDNAVKNHQPFTGELLKYKKDGTPFWTQVTMTPIVSDEGGEERFIFIESDITPRKLAEEKMNQYMKNLEKTNSELDKFAYVVSHDLKAPLRAIGNLTGWIEEDIGDRLPDDVRGHFNIIKGRVVRMEGLIDGILDYTKAAKKGGELVSFPSDELVRETIDLIGPPQSAVINVRANLPVMKTERVKLQQVFLNLIHNAIKYNDKEDVQIDVGCEDAGNEWKFFVKDNGPGIEARYHDKIFVIFQTLNARDEVESRGVGLAIVKKIIEEEGGKIWLDSDKGKGATFYFTWPKMKKVSVEDSFLQEMSLA